MRQKPIADDGADDAPQIAEEAVPVKKKITDGAPLPGLAPAVPEMAVPALGGPAVNNAPPPIFDAPGSGGSPLAPPMSVPPPPVPPPVAPSPVPGLPSVAAAPPMPDPSMFDPGEAGYNGGSFVNPNVPKFALSGAATTNPTPAPASPASTYSFNDPTTGQPTQGDLPTGQAGYASAPLIATTAGGTMTPQGNAANSLQGYVSPDGGSFGVGNTPDRSQAIRALESMSGMDSGSTYQNGVYGGGNPATFGLGPDATAADVNTLRSQWSLVANGDPQGIRAALNSPNPVLKRMAEAEMAKHPELAQPNAVGRLAGNSTAADPVEQERLLAGLPQAAPAAAPVPTAPVPTRPTPIGVTPPVGPTTGSPVGPTASIPSAPAVAATPIAPSQAEQEAIKMKSVADEQAASTARNNARENTAREAARVAQEQARAAEAAAAAAYKPAVPIPQPAVPEPAPAVPEAAPTPAIPEVATPVTGGGKPVNLDPGSLPGMAPATAPTGAPTGAWGNTAPTFETGAGAVTQTPTNPETALTNQTLDYGPLADRFKIAQDQLKTYDEGQQPMFQANLRDAMRKAAAGGAIGSGMLQSSLGDVVSNADLARRTQGSGFLNNALTGSIGDAKDRANFAAGQQGFQRGQQQDAFGNAITGALTNDQLIGSDFQRELQKLLAGQTGNPADTDLALSGVFGNAGSAAGSALGGMVRGTTANGGNNTNSTLQAILDAIGKRG